MKRIISGALLVAGALWISACAPFDPAVGGGTSPVKRQGVPGVMNQGGMLDDELNFGRSYQ